MNVLTSKQAEDLADKLDPTRKDKVIDHLHRHFKGETKYVVCKASIDGGKGCGECPNCKS